MSDTTSTAADILVIGAGELGMAVLRELVRQRDADKAPALFVLLRPSSVPTEALAALHIKIERLDIATATEEELADIFSRYRQIICCTGFVGGAGTQLKITAAAIKAGVEHYIPWQFGVDYDIVGRGSGQQVWDEQLDVRDMLRAQTRISWTIISTGIFTSFVFIPAFGLVDLESRTVRALGDWDNTLTTTTPEDIGHLTARVAYAHASFHDQIIHVAGDTFSYRDLADMTERVLGQPVTRIMLNDAQLRDDVAAHPEDTMARYRLAFARADGVAWPRHLTLNARLNISMTDAETWLRNWLRNWPRHGLTSQPAN